MRKSSRPRHRLAHCLAGMLAALLVFADGARGAQQTEVAQAQSPAVPTAPEGPVTQQQSVQDVSDALGRRLDQMIASQRPLPVR